MHRLDMTRDAHKFLCGLDAKQFKQVATKILELMRDPTPADSQQLKGFEGRRTDIGEYRIVYTYDSQVVYIVVIDKRNDDAVYKQLKKK
ncbi:MAG TPA: type II toxin-antitoxin system RelE/ParE family toxin [Chthonomonadaceae bacterium]|nr:type II toxin-antitoxin system RelE/ParE family toxin [Chthonomonadaceae bacterium]